MPVHSRPVEISLATALDGARKVRATTDTQDVARFGSLPPGQYIAAIQHSEATRNSDIEIGSFRTTETTIPLRWPDPPPTVTHSLQGAIRLLARPADLPRGLQFSLLERSAGRLLRTAATDPEGRFTIPATAPGLYFQKIDTPASLEPANEPVALQPRAPDTPLQIIIGTSACGLPDPWLIGCSQPGLRLDRLAGRLAGPGGAPIPGAGIFIYDEHGKEARRLRTDWTGHIGPRAVPTSGYQLLAHEFGFSPFHPVVTITRACVAKPLEVEMGGAGEGSKLVH